MGGISIVEDLNKLFFSLTPNKKNSPPKLTLPPIMAPLIMVKY